MATLVSSYLYHPQVSFVTRCISIEEFSKVTARFQVRTFLPQEDISPDHVDSGQKGQSLVSVHRSLSIACSNHSPAVQSENEFYTSARARIPGLDEHMQEITDTFRDNGLTKIPVIHNDRNAAGQFAAPGLGKVDLYGWDGYPLGFDCDQPERWTELSTRMLLFAYSFSRNLTNVIRTRC